MIFKRLKENVVVVGVRAAKVLSVLFALSFCSTPRVSLSDGQIAVTFPSHTPTSTRSPLNRNAKGSLTSHIEK
jgi:hypothetical protein